MASMFLRKRQVRQFIVKTENTKKQIDQDVIAIARRFAKGFAKEGPRVASVGKTKNGYLALPGYLDSDTHEFKQVMLITPDGRLWTPLKARTPKPKE